MLQIKVFSQKGRFSIRRSIKCSLLVLILFEFSGLAQAQPSFYNSSAGSSYNAFPLNSSTNKVQWIYGPSVFNSAGTTGTPASSGIITKVYFRLGTTFSSSANYTNFTISLAQNQGTSTAWSSTTFVSGLSQVFYAASFTTTGAASTSWYGITLNTPYTYNPSLALVFELKVSAGTGNQVAQTTPSGNQRNWGTYSGTTGSIGSGLVDFGFDLKKSRNDLSNMGITSLTNNCGAASDPVILQIKNTGVVDIAAGQNIPVRTVVTGAGSATFNKVYNRAIKIGNTDTIHMGNLNTSAITGAISLKSWYTFALDSITQNDTNITSKTFLGFVKPKPDFRTTLFCDSIKFTNISTDVCSNATGYKWDFDNGKSSTLYSPTFSYNSPGTYNVKLLVFFGSGLRDSVTKQVIVYAKPQANFYANNQCFGTPIDFSNFSYGVNSYKWSFGDATTSTSTSPSRTYTATGTYSVKLVATTPNNCRDSISKNVIVYTKPVVSFTVTNACAGSNANFNNTSTGGTSFSWDLGDGTSSGFFNPFKIYNTAGTYGITLTVTSSQGCSDKTSGSVTIHPLPVSNFDVQNNCKGLNTSFTNNSTGSVNQLWTFGDATSSSLTTPTTKKYNTAGNINVTFNVTLLVTSDKLCTHSLTKPVTIYAIPKSNFTFKDVCIGVQTDFTNLSTMPSGGGDYIWRFGDGNTGTLANPSYKYAAAGFYDVKLIAISSFGCKDSAQGRVNVYTKPIPDFTSVDVCDGQPVKFINNSSGASSQNWDFGDGAKDNTFNPSHTYASPDIYKVVLTVTSPDNCKEVLEGNVTVKANPQIVFSVQDHCFGTDANFTNFSVGAASYSWIFGDGDSSKLTQTSHTYLTAGNYSVRLRGVSAKGCMMEQTKAIKVFPKPIPDFSATTVCYGLVTPFTNSSSGAIKYAWNFGDGGGSSALTNPSYQYLNSGDYKVLLSVVSSDNCKDEVTKTITVASLPVPIFLVQDVCSGIEVKPANLSQGSIVSQKWNFGDGFTDINQSPTHIYAAPGIYKIQLNVSSGLGCSDSTSRTILIYTKPIIKVSENTVISKGYSTQLFASGGTDYLWSPSGSLDNPSISNPTATPAQETRYTVKVSNAFGCFDTASVNVSLVEDFTIEPYNLITPNTNGQNDVWKIKGIEFYPQASVMIFDQWGRIILEQTNYENNTEKGWNGTMKGKPLPDGTYYYVITLPGNERQYKGTINILRN